jgi:photosystem II stability/assembly factor-like uncharacterized protein
MLTTSSRITPARSLPLILVFLFFAVSVATMNATTSPPQDERDSSRVQKRREAALRQLPGSPVSTARVTSPIRADRETEDDESEIIESRIRYFRERHRELDPNQRLRLVREEYARLEAEKKSRIGTKPAAGTTWVSIGPNNGAGRMTAIAPHPTINGTIYAGADGGGIWKTTNAGVTWTPLSESVNNLNVGALALAPSSPNIVYAGTGTERIAGIGFLKSTDGGTTWIFAATAITNRFFRLSVHPTNPLDILAATESGGLRSLDGGVTWVTVISGDIQVTDVLRDPTNPQILYAAAWSCSSSCNGTVFKSTDGGATWEEKRAGLPPPTQPGSIPALAINPANPQVLYLSFALFGAEIVSHIAKTTDGANSWTDLSSVSSNPEFSVSHFMFNQPFHNNAIVVSPTNSNIVIAGGVVYIRSTDAGATWAQAPMMNNGNVHVDAADLRYQGATLYVANDGGIWSSPDNGENAADRGATLITREYYALANDEVNRNRIFAGSQDNGTDRRSDLGGLDWSPVSSGDGFNSPVNPFVPTIAYATVQSGAIYRTKDAGRTTDPSLLFLNGEITPPYTQTEPVGFGTILLMNPSAPSKLYTCTNRIWATTDGGGSWAPLPTTTTDGSNWFSGFTVTSVAVSSSDPRFILLSKGQAGTGDRMFRSTNGGLTWTSSPNTVPFITNLEIDPHEPSIVYATTLGSLTEMIIMSTDGGVSWTSCSSGLPLVSPQVIRVDPTDSSTLYCGTDLGVYWSTNQGASWTRYGSGLPSVFVSDLRIMEDGSVLRAATYGRGVWEIATPTSNHPPTATIQFPASTVSIAKGTTLTFRGSVSDTDAGDAASATWAFTDDGELISRSGKISSVRHTFNQAGAFWVALSARDTHGARNSATVLVNVYEPFDACATPLVIPSSGPFPLLIQTSNEGATVDVSDPTLCFGAFHTTWFEFTPAVSGSYQFTVSRWPFDYSMILSMWTGPPCGPYTSLPDNCQFDQYTVSAQAGVTLRLMISALLVGGGRPLRLTVALTPLSCTAAISTTTQYMTFNGGSASVEIASPSGCGWSVSSNASWITVASNTSGAGNAAVHYFVDPNPGPARTGTLTVAGQTLSVTQAAGGCAYSLSALNINAPAFGATGVLSITTAGGCAWTAVSNAAWINVTSSGSGSGNGAVGYTIAANTSTNSRSGTVTIAGQVFSITQGGANLKKTVFDLESDARTDLGFYRNGLWGILKSSLDYSFSSGLFFSWGGSGLAPITGDFDGDGQTDVAYIVPPANGQSAAYAILKSSANYDFNQALFVPAGFPVLGDTPVVGDFDGDGKDDPGIWRSSQGVWIVPLSSMNYAGFFFSQWGQSGDKPIVCDVDGDGRADIGFYRNGLWGFLKSSLNYSFCCGQFMSWGGAGLQPLVGDFDGDGKADISYIVPPSGGQSAAYAILKSTANYEFSQALFVPAGFPVLGDTPVVGDFDGDGKDDPGIWRSSQGVWIIPRSSSNYLSFIFSQWGQPGDTAIP